MPYFTWNRPGRLLGVAAVTACAALSLGTTAALADSPVDPDGGVAAQTTYASQLECQTPSLLQPFADFKDNRNYVLAPNGDFSDASGGGWQLADGARIVNTTRPDGTTGNALDLPSGGVAVSPTMCVDLDYPTARAWVRNVAGDGGVDVSVVYDAGKEAHKAHKAGHVHGRAHDPSWSLSADVKVQPQLAGKQQGWRRVAFVLAGTGKGGESEVHGFFVDPRMVR
jgi:hypothetical protein